MVERLAIDGDLSPWGSRPQFLIQPGIDLGLDLLDRDAAPSTAQRGAGRQFDYR